jgi:outer membrane protein TolC
VKVFDQPEVAATQEDLGSGGTETEVGVSWRLPRPDRRRLDVERAVGELTAAQSSFDQIVLDARLDLRRVYAEWWIAARKVEVLEIETDVLGELARRSEERGRVGETSGLEVRRIRLAALETGARAMLARSELATVRAEIGAWRPDLVDAVPPYRPLVPELPPAPKYEPPTRPALAALEAELRASELASALATKPTEMPAVSLGWKRVEPEGAGPTLDGAVVGLTWPVPLPGKGRAERLRAETRRDALEARLDLLRRRFAAELRSAEMSYDQLRGAASEVETALADAEPVVAAARAAFRLGEGDLTTLLDAVRAATEARLAALELQFRALEHQRDLERARGQMFTHPETITQLERDQP